MKNNVFYKSLCLYSEAEEKEFLESYAECLATDLDEELSSDDIDSLYNTEGFRRYLEDDNTLWYEEWSNIMADLMKGKRFRIEAELGLWNGVKHAHKISEGFDAILDCLGDDINDYKVYEERGTLKIVAYHHDGVNYFSIKEITPKGLRSPRLLKQYEVYF